MANVSLPQGDLARVKSIEASDEWPTMLEIVAYWGVGRKGRRRSITIPADQFFGRGSFGAPMSGTELVGMVERLRKLGPGT